MQGGIQGRKEGEGVGNSEGGWRPVLCSYKSIFVSGIQRESPRYGTKQILIVSFFGTDP